MTPLRRAASGFIGACLIVLLTGSMPAGQSAHLPAPLPDVPHAVRFGVVGDTGTGEPPEY